MKVFFQDKDTMNTLKNFGKIPAKGENAVVSYITNQK